MLSGAKQRRAGDVQLTTVRDLSTVQFQDPCSIFSVQQPCMPEREHQSSIVNHSFDSGRAVRILMQYASKPRKNLPNSIYVAKLKTALDFKSSFAVQGQTIHLFDKVCFGTVSLNAIGEEQREVRGMMGGNPCNVFAMLSHLGSFGEVI